MDSVLKREFFVTKDRNSETGLTMQAENQSDLDSEKRLTVTSHTRDFDESG